MQVGGHVHHAPDDTGCIPLSGTNDGLLWTNHEFFGSGRLMHHELPRLFPGGALRTVKVPRLRVCTPMLAAFQLLGLLPLAVLVVSVGLALLVVVGSTRAVQWSRTTRSAPWQRASTAWSRGCANERRSAEVAVFARR